VIRQYFEMVVKTAEELYKKEKDSLHDLQFALEKLEGRLFILGVGGSAANASHAASDFRKMCGIEAYAPTDNVAEITARTNDEGFETVFVEWLKVSKLTDKDMVLVFSVGGGNKEKNISVNLINALDYAVEIGAKTAGIIGRDGGYTKKVADICVVIPTVNEYLITPFAESFQAVIWHMLVFLPSVKINEGKWESIALQK